MATDARKFQVGVFVLAALFVLVAGLIWLGASRFFEKTSHLVTYFPESVQGVEPGSAVKYRGVPAGRVQAIRIAPDGDLIEVVMSIEDEFVDFLQKDPSLRAQIQLAGITGFRYIEIDRHSGEALKRSPKLDFEPPYPVILSTPSSIREIQTALEEVYNRIMSIDFAGISGDIRETLQAANTLLRDERVGATLNNINTISDSAARVAKNLERITDGVDVKPAVKNIEQVSMETRELVTALRTVTRDQLDQALGQITQLAQSAQQLVGGLQYTAERIDRTVGNLEHFTEELRGQPSLLLFSEPPRPKRPGDRP